MREIKFRWWYVNNTFPEKSYMDYNPEYVAFWETEQVVFHNIKNEYHSIMQYCWLKDKNWVEIYESDLIRINYLKDKIYIVKWDNNMAAFQIENLEDKIDADFFNWQTLTGLQTWENGNCEVIWNIYENLELLTNK